MKQTLQIAVMTKYTPLMSINGVIFNRHNVSYVSILAQDTLCVTANRVNLNDRYDQKQKTIEQHSAGSVSLLTVMT